jgi:hypothetical protein
MFKYYSDEFRHSKGPYGTRRIWLLFDAEAPACETCLQNEQGQEIPRHRTDITVLFSANFP